ncbi:hypothetical protein ILUMI_10591 [Ignelater luminosus]|uniref:Reverse transcriptase n=1 Tax=Ignelater luminosus TaxID=2038154 RepID=A0A8K0D1X0_IGNLU|nr:hypothetical protein ILUMI_10591 [Ignelater luminosus]
MYRDKDKDSKNFMKEFSNEDIEEYKLDTVPYGTASAPFLAVRTLHRLANDKAIVKSDFYMDDLLTGRNNINELLLLKQELEKMLAHGSFHLYDKGSYPE